MEVELQRRVISAIHPRVRSGWGKPSAPQPASKIQNLANPSYALNAATQCQVPGMQELQRLGHGKIFYGGVSRNKLKQLKKTVSNINLVNKTG